jgi:transglutaminase-like putative cysteine protease
MMTPFHRALAILSSLTVLAGAQVGSALQEELREINALPQVPPGLNGEFGLKTQSSGHFKARYSGTIDAPNLVASQWRLFLPKPPDLPSQKIRSVTIDPEGEAEAELSPLRRQVMHAVVPANDPVQAKKLSFSLDIQAELFARRLVTRSADMPPAPAVDTAERRRALRRTPMLDYQAPAVKGWMAKHDLTRGEAEGEVAFARRVFQTIARSFSYSYQNAHQDRSAAGVIQDGRSDCGGMAVLFVTVLRSQGIPARLLAGRWAQSANAGERMDQVAYFQEHVKAEFHAHGVGWIPADLSSAVLHDPSEEKTEFFGKDRGDFITFHIDPELVLDTRNFGGKPHEFLQKASYWATGLGNFDRSSQTENWTCEPINDPSEGSPPRERRRPLRHGE